MRQIAIYLFMMVISIPQLNIPFIPWLLIVAFCMASIPRAKHLDRFR